MFARHRKGDAFLTANDNHVKKTQSIAGIIVEAAKEMHEECRRQSAVNVEFDKHEYILCT